MAWYVNDLSLNGHYSSPSEFLTELNQLMRLRQTMPALNKGLYCSRNLHTYPVSRDSDFRQAVQSSSNKRLVLEWITKRGPFWDDNRETNADDYFEYKSQDITDLGLGEAARCQLARKQAISFSFSDAGFDYSPIVIDHGLPEARIGAVPIKNIWDFDSLRDSVLDSEPPPVNWKQMLELAKAKFDKLLFPIDCIDKLKAEPFSESIVDRIFVLLGVLQEFIHSLDEDGNYSDRNHEMIRQYFSGDKAWFSDESATNKSVFKEDLTFSSDEQTSEKVFCPWHGKIKTPQYRIHFEWPVKQRTRLRIFYIGPKITKA